MKIVLRTYQRENLLFLNIVMHWNQINAQMDAINYIMKCLWRIQIVSSENWSLPNRNNKMQVKKIYFCWFMRTNVAMVSSNSKTLDYCRPLFIYFHFLIQLTELQPMPIDKKIFSDETSVLPSNFFSIQMSSFNMIIH